MDLQQKIGQLVERIYRKQIVKIYRYLWKKTLHMNVAELQLQLHKAIDTVTDSAKLEAIYTLLEDSKGPFKSMPIEEYVGAIDESRQQIKEGKCLSADDLEKQSENW